MLKLFNRKKKDNKGFTLVELVIVIAILAILVGLLAPQYTKYVEKSRKTADVNNLEEIVKEIKVVASDPTYAIPAGEFNIVIKSATGTSGSGTTATTTPSTTISFTQTGSAAVTGSDWTKGLKALMEGDWTENAKTSLTSTSLTLKSNKWKAAGNIVTGINANDAAIGAKIVVKDDGTMVVSYDPAAIKNGAF